MGKRSRKRIKAGLQPPSPRATTGPAGPNDTHQPRQGGTKAASPTRVEDTWEALLAPRGVAGAATTGPLVDALAAWWEAGIGRRSGETPGTVPTLACAELVDAVGNAWLRGWQPADLHRTVKRELGAVHVAVALHAMALQAESYRSVRPTLPSWLAQLDAMGAVADRDPATDHLAVVGATHGLDHRQVLMAVLAVLGLLRVLPDIARLCPPPTEWGRSAALAAGGRKQAGAEPDIRYLERIRALLAKAESTEFEEEAASLTAKAYELMTRHAIDAALVEAHAAGQPVGERPGGVRIGIDDPYAQAKVLLLTTIGNCSRCTTVWSKQLGFATVFGYTGDLQAVELLYTSLLLQAGSAMKRAGELGGWARRRDFRQSFLMGFGARIGTRLLAAAEATTAQAEREVGSEFLPVLAERSRRVEQLSRDSFPVLREIARRPNINPSGWVVGSQAAEEAELFVGSHLERRASA